MKAIDSKIVSLEKAQEMCNEWKNDGINIVFTNGCFDLLHKGHVKYLEEARNLGDRLVVGLNSDNSTSRLKGPNRPIVDEMGRAAVLAALESVSLVVLFDEDTPAKLIEQVQPDILVKGGDYRPEEIVGSDFVTRTGGRVVIIPFLEGYSTSAIEQKIANGNPNGV